MASGHSTLILPALKTTPLYFLATRLFAFLFAKPRQRDAGQQRNQQRDRGQVRQLDVDGKAQGTLC